jgi:small subunit ribosomal protein S16
VFPTWSRCAHILSNLEYTTPVAVKIKLMRLGKIRNPQYRIVVADARTKRDGRAIEEIGKYRPKEDPSYIEVNSERVQYWLGVGAQPTDPVLNLLKITGDWQKFKGLPGAEGRLKLAPPKPDKKALFQAAAKEAMKEDEGAATASKSKKRAEPKKAEPKKAEAKKKAEPKKAKDEAKVETKADSKADAKDEAKAETKADAKDEAKAETKADAKADSKADAKAAKADTKAETKADSKAEAKTDAKAAKADAKADAKTDKPKAKKSTQAKTDKSAADTEAEPKAAETPEAKSEA